MLIWWCVVVICFYYYIVSGFVSRRNVKVCFIYGILNDFCKHRCHHLGKHGHEVVQGISEKND